MEIKRKKILSFLGLSLFPTLTSFGLIFGYYLSKFLAGEKTGRQGKIKSLIFYFREWKIHLHHWFVSAIFLFVFLYYDLLPISHFFSGFLGGICLQGLSYPDWYRIITKKQ